MLAVWILGILAAAVIALCLVPVGVRVCLTGREEAAVDLRLAWLNVRLSPQPPERARKTEKKRTGDAQKQTGPAKRRPALKFTRTDVMDAVRTLWPPLKRALRRTRRGIRISPLDLTVTLAGAEDPAEAARLYGWAQAAVWTGMPLLEELAEVRDPHVRVRIDFDATETRAEGTIGVSARIGTLLGAALGVGIPALRWLLRLRKRQGAAERPAEAAA